LNQTFLDGRHIPTRAVMPNVAASASDDPRRLIQRRNVMTAINAKSEAINAKSEALELHELSSELRAAGARG
jgi:hypothetical protein